MEDILKVIRVWKEAEETLILSAEPGSYTAGYHAGYIKALDYVEELLSLQHHVQADAKSGCPSCPVPPLSYPFNRMKYCPYCGTKIRTA